MFVVNVFYIVERFFDMDANYMPDEEGVIKVYSYSEEKNDPNTIVVMVLLTVLVLTSAAFKLMFYLKIYESFGMLV
jgi:hypothetical protein